MTTADPANERLNEAVALAMGWTLESGTSSHRLWHRPKESGHICSDYCFEHVSRLPWATDVQACIDDLLPVMRAKVPGKMLLLEDDSW